MENYPPHAGVLCQKSGDLHRILAVAYHAQLQRFKSVVDQPGIPGIAGGAGEFERFGYAGSHQLLVEADDDTRNRIAAAVEELGSRMYHKNRRQSERAVAGTAYKTYCR